MRIADIKCSCGSDNVKGMSKGGNKVGIYCMKCGKWLKWANTNEKNLIDIEIENNYNKFLFNLNLPLSESDVIKYIKAIRSRLQVELSFEEDNALAQAIAIISSIADRGEKNE